MKQRNLLSAAQLAELHEFLGRRLDAVGIDSQPEVAMKLLELSGRTDAQLRDYAEIIRTDSAISGRVMRLANSAMFAQRKSVTNIDRACTLLGVERLKAVALGFHLSRAATAKDASLREVSRRVWGHSVFRACMASVAARFMAPGLGAEAFVVGLMIDAGVPLAAKLAGDAYVAAFESCSHPVRFFRAEFETMEFTHVDVISVLCRRWRFPEIIARPIELHHTRPAEYARDDQSGRLHRIAYAVGQLELDHSTLTDADAFARSQAEGLGVLQRVLRLRDEETSRLIGASVAEYKVMIEIFSDVATRIPDIDSLAVMAHNQLVGCIDDLIARNLVSEQELASNQSRTSPLIIHDSKVEFVREADGAIVAFVTDDAGRRVVSHRLAPSGDTPRTICESLGLEPPTDADAELITGRIRSLAA
jgi:HD-like signal output (HDOD) protein